MLSDRLLILCSLFFPMSPEVRERDSPHRFWCLCSTGKMVEIYSQLSRCLSVLTYHILANPEILDTLTQELKEAIPDPQHLPHWATLEKLPYLNSVVQEGLRLSYGASGRSPRIATEEDLVYRGGWKGKSIRYVIPRGYAVGMSAFISHHDETLFPESHKFQPERWLDLQHRRELDRGFLGEPCTEQDTRVVLY